MAIKQQLLDLKKQDKKRQLKKSQDFSNIGPHSATHNNLFKNNISNNGVLSPDIMSSPTGREDNSGFLSSSNNNFHE